ncbi:MAG TPA: hypothetical protein VFN10_00330 [Thermoanaerobaculia bacterium]|nr:hypothetical protein [Thermoanaerobaculia bacterium]
MSEALVTIDSPAGGTSVGNPLTITGTLRDGVDPASIEVMLDRTTLANLRDAALFDGNTFLLQLAPRVSEGAHILWARERYGRGFARRDVYVSQHASQSERIVTVPAAWHTLFAPKLRIDGHAFPARWKRMRGKSGLHYVASADLSALAAGMHQLEVVSAGRVMRAETLQTA